MEVTINGRRFVASSPLRTLVEYDDLAALSPQELEEKFNRPFSLVEQTPVSTHCAESGNIASLTNIESDSLYESSSRTGQESLSSPDDIEQTPDERMEHLEDTFDLLTTGIDSGKTTEQIQEEAIAFAKQLTKEMIMLREALHKRQVQEEETRIDAALRQLLDRLETSCHGSTPSQALPVTPSDRRAPPDTPTSAMHGLATSSTPQRSGPSEVKYQDDKHKGALDVQFRSLEAEGFRMGKSDKQLRAQTVQVATLLVNEARSRVLRSDIAQLEMELVEIREIREAFDRSLVRIKAGVQARRKSPAIARVARDYGHPPMPSVRNQALRARMEEVEDAGN